MTGSRKNESWVTAILLHKKALVVPFGTTNAGVLGLLRPAATRVLLCLRLTCKSWWNTSWDIIWTGMRIFVFFNKLTLNLLSCILFVVVLSCSFIAWKNQSARHCKNSHFALCSQVASDILQSRKICRKQLFVQSSGIKELAFHAITTTLISTAQTAFILLPLPERLFAVF